MAEIPQPPPRNPISLSASDQILAMTLLKWCASNLVGIPRNHPATFDDKKVTTYHQGTFYWGQLINETIPHKIAFKWKRTYNQNIQSEVDNCMDKDPIVQLHNLYNFAQIKSDNFLIKI